MPKENETEKWCELLHTRYRNYLQTSFYFKDKALRNSFAKALELEQKELMKGPFQIHGKDFQFSSANAQQLAAEFFSSADELKPALRNEQLYTHQEESTRRSYKGKNPNIVVATGTASGKTESFLYPIFFKLFQQYQAGELDEPGVRALILYPMNALANDQRERLGKICQALQNAGSRFIPTFGQYTGETPEDKNDNKWRNPDQREKERQPGELVFRSEMRQNPPHILLTNYSMLEYLLIRPQDSALFDNGGGRFWQFIVLDEAHQYRGTKGMEMAMLIRRLKQRIREGGRGELPFHCIATSATITSEEDEKNKEKVADFAGNLFGEKFDTDNVIFGKEKASSPDAPTRYHTFMRALEGAFLIYEKGKDKIVFNRRSDSINGDEQPEPLEIALCRECGQHYYVGGEKYGKLHEAVRDPSDAEFGVSYYLPIKGIEGQRCTHYLCKLCGKISSGQLRCHPNAIIEVCQCRNHEEYKDQLKECKVCGYQRGSIGDPVSEVVRGSDGPNAVIATALHEQQCQNEDEKSSRVLAFADSRQEASFFAWYAENSFNKIRDRNFIWRALNVGTVDDEGLSVGDLQNRLQRICEKIDLFFGVSPTQEGKKRQILKMIYSELLTDDKRISLQGTGLVQWQFKIPPDFKLPEEFGKPPWNKLPGNETKELIQELLLDACSRGAAKLIDEVEQPNWGDLGLYGQTPKGFVAGERGKRAWASSKRSIIRHYLQRVLINLSITNKESALSAAQDLMESIWDACISGDNPLLVRADNKNNDRLLDLIWLRVLPKRKETPLYQCDICARVYFRNIGKVCPRNNCPGELSLYRDGDIKSNHYATLYQNEYFPAVLSAEEHTAQLKSEEARERQNEFKEGKINLLSSSTTFEVGVDLGNLEVVFMRNVPPEAFNYTQRAGRAGRRETPGFVLTYCRRNPHDLYHYEDPEEHILHGKIRPPILKLQNEKIILRHIVAVALSFFFRKYEIQFQNVASFVENWDTPTAAKYFYAFCNENADFLLAGLKKIVPSVPSDMYDKVGFADGREWIEKIAGPESGLAEAEKEVCADYCLLRNAKNSAGEAEKFGTAQKIKNRMKTIEKESTIDFLSRKAIIPKYGFPVDIVELDTWGNAKGVILQRDLSQAIAEYAPSGKVVANKKEWESVGIKKVAGQEPPIYYCQIDDNNRSIEWGRDKSADATKCIIPKFGFVTRFSDKEKEPRGRARRLFATRPYFVGFVDDQNPLNESFSRVKISKATPGTMVVLCKGKNGDGFYICQSCYAGFVNPEGEHRAPNGNACSGTLERSFLAHEFVTDVVRLQFGSLLIDPWEAYSLAYALLLGAAQTLQLPAGDLNATITGGDTHNNYAIILYDDVPGGAGLVASLYQEDILKETLNSARQRMLGGCGCDSSCYGCLRSYRNQFAHPYLDRKRAFDLLNGVLPK